MKRAGTAASSPGWIWLDGRLEAAGQATVDVRSHALHYGSALFEGIRCYRTAGGGTAAFRLTDHLQRLVDSARLNIFSLPYSREELADAVLATVCANGLGPSYVRVLAFPASTSLGLEPEIVLSVAVIVVPWDESAHARTRARGIRVCISSLAKPSVRGHLLRSKTSAHYMSSILARREAILAGLEDAILLDCEGRVMEATTANVFAVRNGRLTTPPPVGLLPGITRDSILELARDSGLPFEERALSRDDLYLADELFLTGTFAEVTPVVAVDHRIVGSGSPGPLTRELADSLRHCATGASPKRSSWITEVSAAVLAT